MEQAVSNFTAEEVKRVISGKFELYQAVTRYGYYLPKYKSNMITEAYLTQVLAGELYCPKYEAIRLQPCPLPPDKDTLLKAARAIKTPGNKSLGIEDEDHLPDKGWLLAVLSTHRPDHSIFGKGYVPPPRSKKLDMQPSIQLPSDFLDGLPASRKVTKAKRLTMISKGKTEAKLERAKFLAKKYGDDQLSLKQKIEESKKQQVLGRSSKKR